MAPKSKKSVHTIQMENEGGADSAYTLFHIREEVSKAGLIKVTMLVSGAATP